MDDRQITISLAVESKGQTYIAVFSDIRPIESANVIVFERIKLSFLLINQSMHHHKFMPLRIKTINEGNRNICAQRLDKRIDCWDKKTKSRVRMIKELQTI
ncbi:MAG: hypothetical protein CL862_07025 [Cyanobium sp. NAT70]|nr:hypothetical protein [Cyanobium sp. NAT70]